MRRPILIAQSILFLIFTAMGLWYVRDSFGSFEFTLEWILPMLFIAAVVCGVLYHLWGISGIVILLGWPLIRVNFSRN